MTIAENQVVSINYTLTNNDGDVIDSSDGREPLAYLHGAGQILPALESALEGKNKGEKLEVKLPAEQGYGERDENLVRAVPKEQFPADANVQVGDQFQVESNGGPMVVSVVKVGLEEVTVDANHPLAGVDLTFAVEVVDFRAATKDELEHGHAHGPGGHSHD